MRSKKPPINSLTCATYRRWPCLTRPRGVRKQVNVSDIVCIGRRITPVSQGEGPQFRARMAVLHMLLCLRGDSRYCPHAAFRVRDRRLRGGVADRMGPVLRGSGHHVPNRLAGVNKGLSNMAKGTVKWFNTERAMDSSSPKMAARTFLFTSPQFKRRGCNRCRTISRLNTN
jgi:hypothetical protein